MTSSVTPPTPASAQDAGVAASAAKTRRHTLPRGARVRRKAEFAQVFESGKRIGTPLLALHWYFDDGPARLGLAVSRKTDPHAVGRNRIKRALREAFRQLRPCLRGGAYVLVARRDAAQADGRQLRAALNTLLQRAGALSATQVPGTMPAVFPSPRRPAANGFAAGPEQPDP
ncbi:ribonuclease P protein component [Thermomonas hydrothermalis]|jgi:ribonuclease P protein component|uniref:Ribonuclease P protein component n=1 Tax=Thermomonas hydrothermalis TaxID=213588 RepID=A0A1M4TUY7_9GAMM|nr:ribonuclease P protein component [Thermomonas hydrothermalis]